MLVWLCGWVHPSHTHYCAGMGIEPKGLHPECQNLGEVKKAVIQLEIHIVRKVISWFRWCLVCLDVCHPRDVVRVLSCHHIFHERWCIEPWLFRHRTCLKFKCGLLKPTGTEVTIRNEEKSLVAFVENGKRRSKVLHCLKRRRVLVLLHY